MLMIQKYQEWLDKKIDKLTMDDKHWILKSWLYGTLGALPEGLAVFGAAVFAVSISNFIQGNGFTVFLKD